MSEDNFEREIFEHEIERVKDMQSSEFTVEDITYSPDVSLTKTSKLDSEYEAVQTDIISSESEKGDIDSKSMEYTIPELMSCIIARELKDDDTVAIGIHSELMLTAIFLAQKLYAPNIKVRHGLNANKNAELNPAAWTMNRNSKVDYEYIDFHDSILSMANPYNVNRLCDVFFVGGMQIDKHGNTNLIGIKGKNKFRLRGPGSIGTTSIAQFSKRYYIFTFEHSPRIFVEKVDYISTAGYDTRKKAGLEGGPKLIITPYCVMDFENGSARLKSIHEHSSIEEVKSKTGFELIIPEKVETTKPPTEEELKIIREIDKNKELEKIEKKITV